MAVNEKDLIKEVPEDAVKGFLEVRESGLTNMLDSITVWRLMSEYGYYEGCDWLIDPIRSRVDSKKYMALIHAVEDYLIKNEK